MYGVVFHFILWKGAFSFPPSRTVKEVEGSSNFFLWFNIL